MSNLNSQYINRIWSYIDTSLDRLARKEKSIEKYIERFYCRIYLDVKISDRIKTYWASCEAETKKEKIKGFVLTFNSELFSPKMTIKFRREIITHELAHCIDDVMRGVNTERYHDEHWQKIHKLLGGTGKRCVSPIDVL